MSRFIRSALFPILIVIIVAMFIEWVISGNKANTTPEGHLRRAVRHHADGAAERPPERGGQDGHLRLGRLRRRPRSPSTGGQQYYVTGITDTALRAAADQDGRTRWSTCPPAPSRRRPTKDVQPSFTQDVVNGRVAVRGHERQGPDDGGHAQAGSDGNQEQYTVAYTDPAATTAFLDQYNVPYDATSPKSAVVDERAVHHPAYPAHHRLLVLHHEPDAGRRLQGHELRQEQGQARQRRLAQGHVQGRGRRRRGGRGAARDQGVPREPQEVPAARRAHPQGRAAVRPARHRQDAARARRRRRGGRPVLQHQRLRLRRDVRRRRRLARARPVRAGQAERALHHLRRRDRRRRPPPRRRHGRRPRRARADAQPAARRDGRLRDEGQHHPHRRHQPPRHPRPGAAAPGPLRPPDRRRPPGPPGPQADPRGPLARQTDRQGHRPRRAGRADAGLHRRRPRQPRERGGAARGAPRQEAHRHGRARRGHHARARRSREEDAHHQREGEGHHRLPRDGPRAGGPLPRVHRPGAQDLRRQPRPGARLHHLAADRGQVPDHQAGAHGHALHDARRSRRGGGRVRRDHHRRRQRPREGDRRPPSR